MEARTPNSDVAKYIAELTAELARMAHMAGYRTLAFIIATSSLEANNIVHGVSDDTRSLSDQRYLA
jgi:hypothetical protein